MAQATNTYDRYDIKGAREDLSEMVYMISPTEVPLQSNFGVDTSESTLKQWQIDALPDAADIKKIDGDVFSANEISATSVRGNYHQIAWYGLQITRRADIVNKAGRRSEIGYQIARYGKALRRSQEKTISTRKAAVAGGSSTASETAGIPAWIATNDQLGASGTSPTLSSGVPNGAGKIGTARGLKEAHINKAALDGYTQGGVMDFVCLAPALKAALSKFLFSSNSRIATQYQDQGKRPNKGTTVVGAVDVYVTDFFVLDIVPDRFVPSSATASEVMVLDSSMWEISYLSPYHIKEISAGGDSERRMLIVDYALCAKNEASSAVIAAVNNGTAVAA